MKPNRDNVFLYQISGLPRTVKAFICIDNDGNYNILVNKILTFGEQELAIQHELEHLYRNDLENSSSIYEIE